MGLFRRRSSSPDLKSDVYDHVTKIFREPLAPGEQSRREGQELQRPETSSEPGWQDFRANNNLNAHRVIRSFVDFALLPLDDVYVFHGHSAFLPDAVKFSVNAEPLLQSQEVQLPLRILADQGVKMVVGQVAAIMQPYMAMRLGHSGKPFGADKHLAMGLDLRLICNDIVLFKLLNTWLLARNRKLASPKVLGLACGWILVQWLEWSESTEDAFLVSEI